MRKQQLAVAACVGCLALFAAGGKAIAASPVVSAGEGQTTSQEQEAGAEIVPLKYDTVPAWGTITSVQDGRIVLNNLATGGTQGEVVIHLNSEQTKVLDAVAGLPVAAADLKEGDFIYAYLEPVMTMSLPPQTSARVIIGKAPADFRVPEFLYIKDAVMQDDGSVDFTSYNGKSYHIPADCPITPYLTRQMASLQDLTSGRSILLWSDYEDNAAKIVVFNPEQ